MAGFDDHDGLPAIDPGILGAANEGCRESRLLISRRSMMGVTAALFSTAFMPNFALANTGPDARFLVVVLRGGMDGMHMVIPKLDPLYPAVRRELALPFASTLSLGTDFALHPGLARVHTMFNAGEAAVVPAAGLPLRNRSHFECQDNLENGLSVNAVNATGWLNRALGALPAGDPIRVAHGIEIGEAPLILRGPEPVLGWSPTWFEKSALGNVARLRSVYTANDPELWNGLSLGLAADNLALSAGATTGDISGLRKGFIGAARLMRAATGPRISVLSVGGWDTHTNQGGVTGQFNDRLLELDEALGDLKTELGAAAWAKTVAICVTEFGRTVNTNGDEGTDHGIGTVSLLVGGALKGGIVGDWPGLAAGQLWEGDLRPTVDLRSLFKGILRDHIGVPGTVLESTVFPDSAAAPATDNLVKTPAPAARLPAKFVRPPTLQEVSPIARYRAQYGV